MDAGRRSTPLFIAGSSAVCLATWRLNETMHRSAAGGRSASSSTRSGSSRRCTRSARASSPSSTSSASSQLVTDAAVDSHGRRVRRVLLQRRTTRPASATCCTRCPARPVPRSTSFPMPRNTKIFEPTFCGTGVVRIDDVIADERYGQNAPYNGMPPGHLPVRSYLAVPVRSRGSSEVLGGLFFGHPEVGVFTERDERIAVGIATQAAIAFDNARLYQAERERTEAAEGARARLTMLADAGRLLVASLDPDTTLTQPRADLGADARRHLRHRHARGGRAETGRRLRDARDGGPRSRDSRTNRAGMRTTRPSRRPGARIGGDRSSSPRSRRSSSVDWTVRPSTRQRSTACRAPAAIIVPLLGRDRSARSRSRSRRRRVVRTHVRRRTTCRSQRSSAAARAWLSRTRGSSRPNASSRTADRATRRLALLAETGRLIAATLDEDVALQHLAQLTVPTLADVCLIDILADDGTIRAIATGAPGLEQFADRPRAVPARLRRRIAPDHAGDAHR